MTNKYAIYNEKEKGQKKPEFKAGVFSLSDIKEPKIIVSFK